MNQNEENQDTENKDSFGKELLSWVFTIAIALFLGWFLSKVVLFNANVPTTSMESTIMKGDNLIGLRLAYTFSEPERGDVVIFPYPDNPEVTYVKRIIGMPGETVEIYDGNVYIDGEILDESEYLTVTTEGECGPFVVPEDSYFMMGDNRNYSLDSRYWENKFVKEEDIIAKVLFRYYPSIGIID
ncbi:MAG: signal peptidase I [Lachnospiraceae bacterium]|nr:signal peptidase I [Lachnospiraceae bacterium]